MSAKVLLDPLTWSEEQHTLWLNSRQSNTCVYYFMPNWLLHNRSINESDLTTLWICRTAQHHIKEIFKKREIPETIFLWVILHSFHGRCAFRATSGIPYHRGNKVYCRYGSSRETYISIYAGNHQHFWAQPDAAVDLWRWCSVRPSFLRVCRHRGLSVSSQSISVMLTLLFSAQGLSASKCLCFFSPGVVIQSVFPICNQSTTCLVVGDSKPRLFVFSPTT